MRGTRLSSVWLRRGAPLLLSFLGVVSIVGCATLIGGVIGASKDRDRPDYIPVRTWQLDTLIVGRKVVVFLRDGTEVGGTFQGIVRDSLDTYRTRFAGFIASKPAPPPYPSPGDSVRLGVVNDPRIYEVELLAYDYNMILVGLPGRRGPTTVPIGQVATFAHDTTSMTGRDLEPLLRGSEAPLLSSALAILDSSGHRQEVPTSDVLYINVWNPKHGLINGLLIGMGVDVLVLAIGIVAASSADDYSSSSSSSCPYLYSHDGSAYVLDAEVFPGSILEALQRTDCARLEHLASEEGVCRLRIANELPEIEHVDQLTLTAVDHPIGSEVVPIAPDRFATITAPRPPLRATGYDGSVVTRFVVSRDSSFWISNPAGRDPEDPSTLRDGLVLRFDRASGTDRMKLVLTIRNTAWLNELEGRLLALPGARLDDWYALINTSTRSRKALLEALDREAGLRVDLWDGGAWQAVGSVPFAGTSVSRSVIVSIDLAKAGPEDVRIRLESTPGLWMVDRVQADFTEDAPVRVTHGVTLRVADRAGRPVRDDLAAIDGRRYRMKRGDAADIEFAVAPALPGMARTYFALCTGYYTVGVEGSGRPQWALMRELATRRGAFGAYATELFNAWMERERPLEDQASLGGPR